MALICVIIATLAVGCGKGAKDKEVTQYEIYEVNAPSQLIVRSQPSKQGDKIVSLPHKTIIHVDKIENGWGHVVYENYEGYVNVDFIKKIPQHDAAKATSGAISDKSGMTLRKFCHQYMPYFILGCFILYLFMATSGEPVVNMIFLIPLCICEIAYIVCTSVWDSEWFLEPRSVGWILTIIDYGLLLALAWFQGIGTFRAVYYNSSGWFNTTLSLIFSLMGGLMLYALIVGWKWEASILIIVGFCVVVIAVLVAIVHYSLRDWSLTWKIVLLNMLIVSTYMAMIYHFAWSILVALATLVFGLMDGTSKTSKITISDNNGNTRTLEVDEKTPYRGTDVSSGETFERNNSGDWMKKL